MLQRLHVWVLNIDINVGKQELYTTAIDHLNVEATSTDTLLITSTNNYKHAIEISQSIVSTRLFRHEELPNHGIVVSGNMRVRLCHVVSQQDIVCL